jgi:hypothetical protein
MLALYTISATCRVRGVARARDDFSVSVECEDSVSFSSQTVHIKMNSGAGGNIRFLASLYERGEGVSQDFARRTCG